jgi:hypothetical protein
MAVPKLNHPPVDGGQPRPVASQKGGPERLVCRRPGRLRTSHSRVVKRSPSRHRMVPAPRSRGARLLDRVSARMASIIFASCESSGCIAMELLDGSSTGVSFTIRSPFGWNEMRLSRPQSGPRRSATHPPSLTCLRRREFDHEIVVHRYEWPIAASGVAFRSHHARSFHPAGMCLAVIDRNEFAGSLPRSFNDHVGRLASDNVRDRVGWATGDIGNH